MKAAVLAPVQPPLQRLPVQRQRVGSGLVVQRLQCEAAVLDPFIAVDHFRMTAPTFPPHPHAGLSAVTYLFDDSPTGLLNRDSLGHHGPIEPGALHWTLAGAGVMHEELPLQPRREAHGLQIFVNLPAAQKLRAPQALQLDARAMPVVRGTGWHAVVPFGRLLGVQAPLALPLHVALAIVSIDAGAEFSTSLAASDRGFALVISGRGRVGDEAVEAGQAFACADTLALRALERMRLALFSGQPLHEPIVRHGPFVMNSEGEIVEAMRRYQQGGMGRLCPAPVNRPREP